MRLMNDIQQIMETIDLGYIEGIHRQGNRELTSKYIHQEFSMFLKDKDANVKIMGIDEWMDNIDKKKLENPDVPKNKVDYTILDIQVHHRSFATVLLDLFYNDKWFAMDHFSLYKLSNKWMIMAKVYHM